MTATQTYETENQPSESGAQEWPRPDFERQVQRLRGEMESAIRKGETIAQNIAAANERAFRSGLPVSVLLGGKDEAQKLAAEQEAAESSVRQSRDVLRKFGDDERGRFFAMREEAWRELHPETLVQFAGAQAAASDLLTRVQSQLGAAGEIADEEQRIRNWNRVAKRLNSTIPAENTNGIPQIYLIDAGESLRSTVARMLLGDPVIRELCRDFLRRDAEARQRAEAHREFLEEQAKSGTIHDPSFNT